MARYCDDRWFLASELHARVKRPAVPVRTPELRAQARELGALIRQLHISVQSSLVRHREEIVESQLVQERIAWLAMELFAAACALSRCDAELATGSRAMDAVAKLAISDSLSRARTARRELGSKDDRLIRAAGEQLAARS